MSRCNSAAAIHSRNHQGYWGGAGVMLRSRQDESAPHGAENLLPTDMQRLVIAGDQTCPLRSHLMRRLAVLSNRVGFVRPAAGHRAIFAALGAACVVIVGAILTPTVAPTIPAVLLALALVISVSANDRLARHNAVLKQQAHFDQLTAVLNRRGFAEVLDREVKIARKGGTRLALLYIDADRLKPINDKHGHAAGDAVLVELAGRLRACAGEGNLVARLGGDEFAVLLPRTNDTCDAARVARTILDAAQAPVLLPGLGAVTIGVSIGVALFPDDAADGAGLLARADARMYQAKTGAQPGRPRLHLVSDAAMRRCIDGRGRGA